MPTTVVDRAVGHYLQEIVVDLDYTDLTAAATTEEIDVVDLPANWRHLSCWAEVITTFSDTGSISNLVVELGETADADSILDGHDVFGPAAGTTYQDGADTVRDDYSGATVKALATATGANLGDGTSTGLDAGKVRYHFLGYRIDGDV